MRIGCLIANRLTGQRSTVKRNGTGPDLWTSNGAEAKSVVGLG